MRGLLVLMGMGVFLFSFAFAGFIDNFVPKITRQVVRVYSYKKLGGGIIIQNYYVLSVAHLANAMIFVNGLPSEIKKLDDDLMYLQVPYNFNRKVKFAKEVHLLEKVYIVGYPTGKKMVIPATICGIDNYVLYLDAKVIGGMSGGGIFNEKGELVGIVHGGKGYPEQILVASSFVAIKRFLGIEE